MSCVVTSGNHHHAESWLVPIKMLGHNILGALPGDEDLPPPNGGDPHPAPFQNDGGNVQGQNQNWGVWDQDDTQMDEQQGPHNSAGQNIAHILGPNWQQGNAAFDLNQDLHQHQDDFIQLHDIEGDQ